MPELPEVESIKRVLEPYVIGKRIDQIVIYVERNVVTPLNDFVSKPVGKKIISLSRKGKFLFFHLGGDLVILSHLRMEGKWFKRNKDDEVEKHDIARFIFDDGTCLVYNDVRKFGILGLYREEDYLKDSPVNKLGKEPFDITAEELHKGLRKRRGPIKSALLDQSLLAGLGNIYVDEVLFITHINPLTEADCISKAQCQQIIDSACKILEMAINCGGSSVRSYAPEEGKKGDMQNHLLVYGKGNTPCPRCGFLLRKIKVGGRGTTYCPICQKEKGKPLVIGVTGKVHSGKSTVANYLTKKGFVHFDADKVAKSLYQNKEVIDKICQLAPDCVVKRNVDLPLLRKAISEDKNLKKEIEDLIHPLVKKGAEALLASLDEKDKVVLDVPLLATSGMDKLCDLIILVEAKEAIRKARLKAEGKDEKSYLSLNENYPSTKTKAVASIVIENDEDEKSLYQKIDELHL